MSKKKPNEHYYRGSKDTNLMSGEFCKGKPVAPATCALFWAFNEAQGAANVPEVED